MLGQQVAEARLGHPRPARLRAEAHVEDALDAGRLQLGDQLVGQEALVADREQRRHERDASLGGGGRVPHRAARLAGLRRRGGREQRGARAARGAATASSSGSRPPATAGHVLDFDDTYLPGSPTSARRPRRPRSSSAPRRARPSARRSTPSRPASRRWARWRAPPTRRSTTAAGTRPRSAARSGAAVAAARLLGLDAGARARGRRASRCCGRAGCARRSAPTASRSRSGWRRPRASQAARLAAAGADVDAGAIAPARPASRRRSARAGRTAADGRARSTRTGSRPIRAACRPTARSRRRCRRARAGVAPGDAVDRRRAPGVAAGAPRSTTSTTGSQAKFSIPYLIAFTLLPRRAGRRELRRRRRARARSPRERSRCAPTRACRVRGACSTAGGATAGARGGGAGVARSAR